MLEIMFYGIKLQHRVIAVSCCTFRYSNPPSNAQMEIKRLVPFDDEGLSLAPTLSRRYYFMRPVHTMAVTQ